MFCEEGGDTEYDVGRLQIVGDSVSVRYYGAVPHIRFGQGNGNLENILLGSAFGSFQI